MRSLRPCLTIILLGFAATACGGGSASVDPCGEPLPYSYLGGAYGYGYGAGDWYGGGGYYGGWSDPYGDAYGYYGDDDSEYGGDDDDYGDYYGDDDDYGDDDGVDGETAGLTLLHTSGAAGSCRQFTCTMQCALGAPATSERNAQGYSWRSERDACGAAVRGLDEWARASRARLAACRQVQDARVIASPTVD